MGIVACPNHNDSQFKKIHDVLYSDLPAYDQWIKNGFVTPNFGPFTKADEVYSYLESFDSFIKPDLNGFSLVEGTKQNQKLTRNQQRFTAIKNKINAVYGNILSLEEVVKKNYDPTIPFASPSPYAYVVKVNQIALDSYWDIFRTKKEKEDIKEYRKLQNEGNYVLNNDMEILPPDNVEPEDYMYQSRLSSLSKEERDRYKRKRDFFNKLFPSIRIVEDYNLNIPGQIDSDGNTVRLNPMLLTRDTLGHEFGHILIDSIGGMSNPLVQEARRQLVDTPLEAEILDKYSDLLETDKERVDKEVIAQAIGIQSDLLFEEEEQQDSWLKWLKRFFSKLKSAFGFERDAVLKLTQELFKGDQHEDPLAELRKEFSEIDKDIIEDRKFDNIRGDIISALRHKEAIYKKTDNRGKVKKITELRQKIESEINNPIQAIIDFQKFAVEQTDLIYNRLQKAKARQKEGLDPISVRELSTWRDYVEGFALLDEIASIAFNYTDSYSKREQLQKGINMEKLQNAIDKKKSIVNAYTEFGVPLIGKFLSKYSGHIKAKFIEAFEKQYNKLTDVEKRNQSIEDYVKEKLAESNDTIEEITSRNIEKELVTASADINYATAWIDNVLDSTDVIVSSMAKATAYAMSESRRKRTALRDEFLKEVRLFEDSLDVKPGVSMSQRDLYNFMIEQDSDGNYTNYMVDAYSQNMWDTYYDYKKQLEDDGYDEEAVGMLLFQWKNENAPMNPKARKAYKEARSIYITKLVSEGKLTEEDANKLDTYFNTEVKYRGDIHDFLSDEKSDLIIEWLGNESWKYRTPLPQWQSKKWLDLVELAGGNVKSSIYEQIESIKENKSNNGKVRFFNFINSKLDEYQPQTSYGHRIHNRLPSVIKHADERIKEGQSLTSAAKYAFDRAFSFLPDDTTRGEEQKIEKTITKESGEEVHFLPIYYSKNLRSIYSEEYDNLPYDKRIDFVDKNKDYFDREYSKLTDKQKSVTPKKTFIRDAAKKLYATKKIQDNQSYALADNYFKYFNNVIDYSEKQNILPEMEMARYFVNNRQVLQHSSKGTPIMDAVRNKLLTKSGVSSNVASQLNNWMDSVFYGKKDISDKTVSKIADTLNKYTSLNMLGLNFVQGTANIALGSTQQWIEAFGGEYYTPKNYLKAKKVYNRNLRGVLDDIGRIKPNSLINILNEKFDTLNEYTNGEFKKNSKFRQMMNSNTMFFTSHAGEHMMQSKVMLAMLDAIEAKDKNGNSLGSVLDNIQVKDGELVFESKDGVKVANFGTEEQNLFEARLKRVLSSMHGEYSELGRVAIQRYALGRMAYMFRKFIVPGFKRRYGRKNWNNMSEQWTEGVYRTGFRFFKQFIKDLSTLQTSAISSNWNNLNKTEKANVKKFLAEASFLLTAIVLVKLISSIKDGDDEDKWILSFLGYQAWRFRTELLFFAHPGETFKILRSPAASMSVIENTIKLAGQLIDPIFSFEIDRYERGPWKDRPKIAKTITNMSPGVKQYYRLRDIEESITWLKN